MQKSHVLRHTPHYHVCCGAIRVCAAGHFDRVVHTPTGICTCAKQGSLTSKAAQTIFTHVFAIQTLTCATHNFCTSEKVFFMFIMCNLQWSNHSARWYTKFGFELFIKYYYIWPEISKYWLKNVLSFININSCTCIILFGIMSPVVLCTAPAQTADCASEL